MNYKLRDLNLTDIDQIVVIHNLAFKGFFLTSLGVSFLKTYYSSCIKSTQTIAIGLFNEKDGLFGFAIGSKKSSYYHKKILLENLWLFFISLIKISLARPKIILRLLFNLNKAPQKQDLKDYAELLSIAVIPGKKGSGFGKLLLNNFESKVKSIGVEKCALTTDFYNNDSVINFYKTNDYKIYYDFVSYPNRKMYKMIKNL